MQPQQPLIQPPQPQPQMQQPRPKLPEPLDLPKQSESSSDYDQGLNSIEFQQDVQQNFQQITVHSVKTKYSVENHIEQSVEIQLN